MPKVTRWWGAGAGVVQAVLLCVLLSACSGDQAGAQNGCMGLAAGLRYCLRLPSDAAPFDVQQEVQVRSKRLNEVALAQVENTGTSFVVALVSPLGPKLMQAQWSPPQLVQEQAPGVPVPPALLAALVQMAVWPSSSVQAGLQGPHEWIDRPGQRQRQLWVRGQLWLDVQYSGELPVPTHMQIRLPEHDLELRIESLL